MIQFGVFADLHYAKGITVCETRTCYQSLDKLKVILPKMKHCDFIMNLGDLINGTGNIGLDEMYLDAVMELLKSYPVYHVVGNHDAFSLPKEKIVPVMPGLGSVYSFDREEIRFIVLDGNFYDNSEAYNTTRHEWMNTLIPPAQIEWLKYELEKCERAILFCHQNLDSRIWKESGLPDDRDPHCVINAGKVRAVIERSGKVKCVIQGHCHAGCETKINGVKYITLSALCEKDNKPYCIVTVVHEKISIQPFYGNE